MYVTSRTGNEPAVSSVKRLGRYSSYFAQSVLWSHRMVEYLVYRLPPGVLGVLLLVSTALFVWVGYAVEKARGTQGTERIISLIQAAIFAIVAFLLGFTFSLTSQRFDERRVLLRDETNAIERTYLRASYLPVTSSADFRRVLRSYAQARLDSYETNIWTAGYTDVLLRGHRLGDRLWSLTSTAGRADPTNVQIGVLTLSLNEMLDQGSSQDIAMATHVPTAIWALVFVLMLGGAITTGQVFAHSRAVDVPLTLMYLVILSAVVFTIVDLDRPQTGLVQTNLAPLEQEIQRMSASE
jgi:hypothetical protein